MSRLEEVEAKIESVDWANDWEGDVLALRRLARALAAEVDELRGKLYDVRMGIGCARGQRTTQYCAEAAQRDRIIGDLLAMLKPDKHRPSWEHDEYHRACEIAGRTEG